MRILIVAPASGLDQVGEMLAAVGGNTPTLLYGTVTCREVVDRISSGQFQAVHFSGHGNTGALEMSDGILPTDMLQEAISSASDQVALVFLNACESITPGVSIYKGGVPYVITWRVAVPDDVAKEFAVAFYQALALSEDVRKAFDVATHRLDLVAPLQEPPILLNGRLAVMQHRVELLAKAVDEVTPPTNYTWVSLVVSIASTILAIAAILVALGLHI